MNTSDSCVYSKAIGSDCVIIHLDVDDMLIFGTSVHVVNKTKKLTSHFEMKDMSEADAILGIKNGKTDDGFSLCQHHYTEKMLKKFNCFDMLPMRTPYDLACTLKRTKGLVSHKLSMLKS